MSRQKTIINRQERNSSQIANVQRKLQSDRQTKFALQTRQNIDKVRPANTAKLSTINRQKSHDEEVDKVQPVNTMQQSTKYDETIV